MVKVELGLHIPSFNLHDIVVKQVLTNDVYVFVGG